MSEERPRRARAGEPAAPPSLRQRAKAAAIGWLVRAVLRTLGATWRVRFVRGEGRLAGIVAGGEPRVIAFWHGRLFVASHLLSSRLIRRGHPVAFLTSRSRDGELGARVGAGLGGIVVRGSTSRGASEGARGLLRALRRGASAMVVPDGPTGPPHEAKPGAVWLARVSGVPLLPLSWSADRAWRLSSWDAMEIPKPFAQVTVAVGEPVVVPRDLDDREATELSARLARTLDELGTEAREAVAPAQKSTA